MYTAIVFFDLDGTLLNNQSQIDESTKDALKQLQQNNVLPIVASGRAPFEIEALIQDTVIQSYVSLNGQYVKVLDDVIYANKIATQDITMIRDYAQEHHHPVATYTNREYKINFITESTERLYQLDHAPVPEIDANFYLQEDIYMLYLFSEDIAIDQSYIKAFGATYDFCRDTPFSIAIFPQGNSKRNGISLLLQQLNLTHLPTFAFGDGNNDMSMLELVDTAIVMANATPEVKAIADYLTASNVDGGIIQGLKHFKLID